jgi:cytosine/uracil/thiamine/allantoin permease
MKEFLKFLLIWISQNLSIPFWMVGHIHLSMNMSIYEDLHIMIASLGMNIIVAIGVWLDYTSQKDK